MLALLTLSVVAVQVCYTSLTAKFSRNNTKSTNFWQIIHETKGQPIMMEREINLLLIKSLCGELYSKKFVIYIYLVDQNTANVGWIINSRARAVIKKHFCVIPLKLLY